MGVWYATREDVKSALDMKETARNNAQVDRAIEAASRSVEALTHRRFYPQFGTRYFDWPNQSYSASYRLWLDQDDLISVSSMTSGGTAISSPNFFMEPANSGPPYSRIELDLGSSASFGLGDTHQRDIAITGLFGYSAETESAGVLAEAMDSSETGVDVSDGTIGVGSILKVDDEYLIVTEKTALDTTQNLQSDITASNASEIVAVTDGTAFTIGEVILLNAERMKIVDIAGNNLIVKRAWDGSTLAAHSSSDVFAYRTLTVTRAALGSSAATHSSAAPVRRHLVPGLVRELTIAEAINSLQQEASGYARMVGSGESAREASGRGLADLRNAVWSAHGRLRVSAV